MEIKNIETVYLVSVQPEDGQSMPKVYFAQTAFEVDEFIQHYDHGSVIVKRISKLPDFTDEI